MSTDVVSTRGLVRTFKDVHAVDGVDLRIEQNSIVGLLGRNGAGKTTLMSLLTGQDFPTAGEVRVFGENPLENDAVLGRTCFVRESQEYPNNFKVRHVLAAGSHFYPRWDAELAGRLLEEFQLPQNRQVQKLSRGMRAAIGLIVGLAARAELTILDEPVLGLDATSRQQFADELLKAYAEEPRTIILSTHLIDEVAPMLEQVIVLDRGRIVLEGEADHLRSRASTLTGPSAAVDALIEGQDVLHREPMGGYSRATVDLPLTPELRRLAEQAGVEAGPVSLQELVVRAGLGSTDRTHEGVS